MSTRTCPSRGTSVFTAASTENVPLPCSGTHTCVSAALRMPVRRSRTRAVTALNLLSQEPQSRSMAVLVASEVVSGPGVRRIGSRSVALIAFAPCSSVFRVPSYRRCQPTPRLRAPEEPTLGQQRSERNHGGRGDDECRDCGRRAHCARLVKLDDRDRHECRLG